MRISEVEANNVEQAMEFVRQAVKDGAWTRDTAHEILHLQDNPDDLIAAIGKEFPPAKSAEPVDWAPVE